MSNTFTRSYPSGMDVSIFKKFFKFVSKKAKKEKYRACTFVRQNKNKFKIFEFFAEKVYRPDISFTVDEESEFETIKNYRTFQIKANILQRFNKFY